MSKGGGHAMQIDIFTLFPAMFAPLEESIVKRAAEKGLAKVNVVNIRDYALDKHQITDDRLYGGGPGMVMKPEPIFAAVEAAQKVPSPKILITSPQGKPFNQKIARKLAAEEQLMIICGHYEGIDERVLEGLGAELISLGDFVLTGGEIPALAIADGVIRLLPGVLGHEEATLEESFSEGLLEYPQYTRPPHFRGMEVPAVLLSGNHAEIAAWRRQKALERTWLNRPELLEEAPLNQEDIIWLSHLKKGRQKPFRLFTALLHYPVYNKKSQIIGTSLTNLDLHDIARACATFGVTEYHIVQPVENQRRLMNDLLEHWQSGFGARYNPHRQQALDLVTLSSSIEESLEGLTQRWGETKLIATSAQAHPPLIGYRAMRRVMEEEGGNYLLLFGTGWGLTDEWMSRADFRLRPLYGAGEYNHLSVRSAASIILDRLLGEKNSR